MKWYQFPCFPLVFARKSFACSSGTYNPEHVSTREASASHTKATPKSETQPKDNARLPPSPLPPSPPQPPSAAVAARRHSADVARVEAAVKARRQKHSWMDSTIATQRQQRTPHLHRGREQPNEEGPGQEVVMPSEWPRAPPQRRGTLIGGAGWEESLRSGDTRITRRYVLGTGNEKHESENISVDVVASGNSDLGVLGHGAEDNPRSNAKERACGGRTPRVGGIGVAGAVDPSLSPAGSVNSSVHRWLQVSSCICICFCFLWLTAFTVAFCRWDMYVVVKK